MEMRKSDQPTEEISFSIVIPTRNEEKDIARTLKGCLAIDYDHKEIIVVDDSTDGTPEIAKTYESQGVRLIHRDHNANGCCGARNLGMQEAKGDVIILLNADAIPQPDFLKRLSRHYEQGADWVLIRSVVLNPDNVWSRYVWALSLATHERREQDTDGSHFAWSEGFSCRREAAKAVGYIPGDFPVPFCRDYLLGLELAKAGYQRKVDFSIPMEHIAPSSLKEFWNNRIWRGSFSPLFAYYLNQNDIHIIFLRETYRIGRSLARILLLFPLIWRVVNFARHIGWQFLPSLYFVANIHEITLIIGSVKGMRKLLKALDVRTQLVVKS